MATTADAAPQNPIVMPPSPRWRWLRPGFTRNVIARAELRHQEYVIETSRAGIVWIALAVILLVPAMLASLAFTLIALATPFIPSLREASVTPLFGLAVTHVLAMNIASYPVVTLVTLGLSANSILREKQGRTWDHLRLTDIGAAAIVRGKWWASLRALLGDHMMVGVLRFGLVALGIAWINPILANRWPGFPTIQPLLGLPVELVYIPLLIAISLVYGVLDAGLTAALGVFTGLAEQGGLVAAAIVVAVRVVGTAGGVALLVLTFIVAYGGGLLVVPLSLVGFVLYGLVIWALLRAAQVLVG